MTTILLADDDADVTTLLEASLRSKGWNVAVVDDGEKALEVATALRPDLIVSDLEMPNMDGFNFCRKLREVDHGRTPFLFLSSFATTTNRIEGLRIGADEFLSKPFNVEELKLRIERILERIRKPTPPPPPIRPGILAQLPLPDVLQILEINHRAATVHLHGGQYEGWIQFRPPVIVSARCGRTRGIKAAQRLLPLRDGTFSIDTDTEIPERGDIEKLVAEIAMPAMMMTDAIDSMIVGLGGPQARLVVSPDAQLDDPHPEELDVIDAVATNDSLSEVLDAIPRPDHDVLTRITNLFKRSVLVRP